MPALSVDGADMIGAKLQPGTAYRVVTYDFRRPDKFSLEQLRSLAIVHEQFARSAASRLCAMLRSGAELEAGAPEQMSYAEFVALLPNPSAMAVFGMAPIRGSAILAFDPAVSFALLDRLYGGAGEDAGTVRDLTDIECAVTEGLAERLLADLAAAWRMVLPLEPKLINIETNPQFAQINPPTEMAVVIPFAFKLGGVRGTVRLCFPFLTLEPILGLLSARHFYRATRGDPSPGAATAAASLPLPVELAWEAEPVPLAVLRKLKKGSLIPLSADGRNQAWLRVGGERLAELRVVRDGRKLRYALSGQLAQALAGLGLGESATLSPPEHALQSQIQSLAAGVEAAVQGLQKGLSDLGRQQAELADQLIFQSPDRELAGLGPGSGPHDAPFAGLAGVEPAILGNFIAAEHPQLAALVLSCLGPQQAALVFAGLPAAVQPAVAARIIRMDRVSPELIAVVDRVLTKKLAALSEPGAMATGGVDSLVGILNLVDRSTERQVIESLEKTDADLAESVKQRMFVFEDVTLLEQSSMATVLATVDENDLLLALKSTPPEVAAFVFGCLPAARRGELKTRLDAMGKVRLREVEAAQLRVVDRIRALDMEGRIVVARPDELT